MAPSCLQTSPGINHGYRQADFASVGKNFADFFNFAILRQVQSAVAGGQWPMADRVAAAPHLQKGGKQVSWNPKIPVFVRVFLRSCKDQRVLLRSRAICRLSRIFSEILQDRHRPPSDLADGLMRNSSSGQKRLIGQRNQYSCSLGGDFKGRQRLAWQTCL